MFDRLLEKLRFSSNAKIDLLHTTDLHSHLIPAIDDGVKNLRQSILIIRQLEDIGFKKIITTPHIMRHRFPNSRDSILYRYEILKKELIKYNITVDLQVASEYYYDEHFLDLINKKELLTFGDNYVLFEFSFHIKPIGIAQVVTRLLELGYRPILAHPERYFFFNDINDYHALKDLGLLFQINLVSLDGFYGKKAKKSVGEIINAGLVDFVGSDIHSEKYVEAFNKTLKNKCYSKIFEKNYIKNDFL